jgi:hypothetical protein
MGKQNKQETQGEKIDVPKPAFSNEQLQTMVQELTVANQRLTNALNTISGYLDNGGLQDLNLAKEIKQLLNPPQPIVPKPAEQKKR